MKWKIDKRNIETDSNFVDKEIKEKKRKLLKVINIICYVCTAILFVFFVIGGVRSCKSKNSSSSNNSPHSQRVVIRDNGGLQYFELYEEDFDNEELFNDLYVSLGEVGTIEIDDEDILYVAELHTEVNDYNIVSISAIVFNDNNFIQFLDENDDTHLWSFNGGSAYIESSADDYTIQDINLEFKVSNTYLEENYYGFYVVLDDYYVVFNEGIFDAITDTVSNFTKTMGLGINAILVLFYSNNQLTVLGTITVIVVGVAFVYFLLRFIFGLIRLRG